jgi:outer membrane protein TolC
MTLPILRPPLCGALSALVIAGCGGQRSPFDPELMSLRGTEAVAEYVPVRDPRGPSDDATAAPETPALDEQATLDDYFRYAALNNPGLEAAFQRWKAAVERLPQVRALPDPRFTYGNYLREVETRAGPMQQSFALSQTFPWFGKLRDREDAAARAARAEHLRFESAKLDLFYRVEAVHNELFYLRRSIEITGENVELLRQFERVARARYRVAATGHPDIIRIQVELGRIEDRLRQLRDLRAPLTARLNAVLSRPADAALPWPEGIEERVTDRSAGELMAALRRHNPNLVALGEEIERERINARIAHKDGLPDLSVGLSYTDVDRRSDASVRDNGDDAVLATFSVNLPIWRDKYEAGVREAVARRLAVANRRLDTANRLEADLQQALFNHQDARRRVDLYRGTLIQQDTADFLDLVDAERTLLEFQLARERALVDVATARADIERLVGARLSDLDDEVTKETTP